MRSIPFLNDVVDLFFPHICRACGEGHPLPGEPICPACLGTLPFTRFHLQPENPFTEIFWGRLPLAGGTAMFYFRKSGRVQQLVHQLKYKNRPQIGEFLGSYYGRILGESEHYRSVEVIVPVPLHPRKQKRRGYNQSASFGRGLADQMNIPLCTDVLQRHRFTTSQTKMGRWERLQNVMEAFSLGDPARLRGKHILLVDDILTTGATLEACATRLLEIPEVRISMATIGIAR